MPNCAKWTTPEQNQSGKFGSPFLLAKKRGWEHPGKDFPSPFLLVWLTAAGRKGAGSPGKGIPSIFLLAATHPGQETGSLGKKLPISFLIVQLSLPAHQSFAHSCSHLKPEHEREPETAELVWKASVLAQLFQACLCKQFKGATPGSLHLSLAPWHSHFKQAVPATLNQLGPIWRRFFPENPPTKSKTLPSAVHNRTKPITNCPLLQF